MTNSDEWGDACEERDLPRKGRPADNAPRRVRGGRTETGGPNTHLAVLPTGSNWCTVSGTP
ncbi:hypothetical protein, partial [Nocardioides massiliensis]|uniref:hypothetical protein n=1 Tax=Nocardioides massiliensis TaxID=1325935 RepID=UPI001C67E10C